MSALKPCPRSIQVGEFEVAISGGVWVAIRVNNEISFSLVQSLFCQKQKIHASEPSPKKS